MTVDTVVMFLLKIIDVMVIWLMLYYVLKNLRKNVRMLLLFKGILFIVVLKVIGDLLNLVATSYLIDYVIMWGPLALIIVFQPEIRNMLEQIGRSHFLGKHKSLTLNERENLVSEIGQAVSTLKKTTTGALIVIERDVSLAEYINRSKKLYADISSELLVSIFNTESPLHDGGVIIQGDKIISAGAVFPTSNNLRISKRLGTRHRAALGIAEETDCISVVVSEETGRVSIAVDSDLRYNLTIEDLKKTLLEELQPKNFVDEIEEDEDGEKNEIDI